MGESVTATLRRTGASLRADRAITTAPLRPHPRFGPGLLVAAAFIGPGTVTTATLAGARFGTALLWAVVFSTLATLVLQEMAARLGLVSGGGLGEALRAAFTGPLSRGLAVTLVLGALVFGNAAFETGNVAGAALGLEALTGSPAWVWTLAVGAAALLLLASPGYRRIERSLIVLVALMSAVFLLTAVLARPEPIPLLRGALGVALPSGSLLTVIALVGTTVVPYNLFLHASAVREKWGPEVPLAAALRASRRDSAVAIALGGLVTVSIVVAASAFFGSGVEITSATVMARQLEPLLGRAAGACFAVGLLAAGLTSAVTAPLAAAWAAAGILGWPRDLADRRLQVVWVGVLAAGVLFAALGRRPVVAILLAQAFNGLLLPVVAVYLLIVVNRSQLVGEHRNGPWANLAGTIVVLVVAALGVLQLLRLAGLV
jgi:manganese transport protein